jgi:transposase-like protein
MKERLISEKGRQALVRKYYRSGMAASRFCLQEGISQSMFRSWLRESCLEENATGNFVPLRLIELDGQLFPLVIG